MIVIGHICKIVNIFFVLESIKKQLKFKNNSDHEIEEPIKIYLAQAPFADKYKK